MGDSIFSTRRGRFLTRLTSEAILRTRVPDPSIVSVWTVPPEGKAVIAGRRQERRDPMCANCGCGIPEDKHGDDRNIAWSEIVAAAEANDGSPTEAVQNMQRMAEQQA
jgi:hypothetical protein